MEQITLINNSPLSVKEYSGQRVVTFKDIDTLHRRPEGTAGRNFRKNKAHFIEGEDFFTIDLTTDEIRRQFGAGLNAGRELYLITESGYLMLVKSFNDDVAWAVQRALVNSYFKGKINPAPQSFLEECGVLELTQEKQTDEEIAKIFLQSLLLALKSGKYYLSPKWKHQSKEDGQVLLGIYDDTTITLISSVAYSIYADFVGLPFNALSISKHISPSLVRSGLMLPRTRNDGRTRIKSKEYCVMRLLVSQANALRGYNLLPERA